MDGLKAGTYFEGGGTLKMNNQNKHTRSSTRVEGECCFCSLGGFTLAPESTPPCKLRPALFNLLPLRTLNPIGAKVHNSPVAREAVLLQRIATAIQ